MVYSAQRLLHHFYFCYVQVAAFAVSYVTVDCNIEDLGCSNVAEIRVEVLLGEQNPIANCYRNSCLFTANPYFLQNGISLPCFQYCELHYEFHVPKQ